MNEIHFHCYRLSFNNALNKNEKNSHVIIVHILFWYGDLCIVLQMGTHPINGMVNLRARS